MKYEIEKLICLITIKFIKFIIFKYPVKKSGGPHGFTGRFYQTKRN